MEATLGQQQGLGYKAVAGIVSEDAGNLMFTKHNRYLGQIDMQGIGKQRQDRQTGRQAGRQAGRQTHRQAGRQAGRQL